jgi:putative pyruvate formate lyase activating enzyme
VTLATERGFRLPVIYNTGGYDSMELLPALDGLVDIYLPDLKYSDPEMSLLYSDAPDYPAAAREAVLEMYRQVGNLRVDPQGVASGGLLVRLLVLPGGISGTVETLEFLAREIGTDVFISLMSQYYPAHRAGEFPPLHRRLRPGEYRSAVAAMERLGFQNGWVQDPVTSPDTYLPGVDFSL